MQVVFQAVLKWHRSKSKMRNTFRTILYGISITFSLLALTKTTNANTDKFFQKLSEAAISRINIDTRYDSTYYKIPYPNGDIPEGAGVCTDVIIRAYRKQGIDLQQLVHDDMRKNFSLYPKSWGLKHTDTNIDHRRVPNLQTFFTRKGRTLPISENSKDYQTGDLVTWNLSNTGYLPHIGIISHIMVPNSTRHLVVHNIGQGTRLEDMLFSYKITGHYRYIPEER